jgi:hypothetical protein
MKELSQVLAKHYGLPEGTYDLRIEFQIGTGPVGPADDRLPGMVLGVKSIGLGRARITSGNQESVDRKLESEQAPKRKRPTKQ